MKLEDAIKLRIDFYLSQNNMKSLWDLYKASGIPKSTINAFLSNDRTRLPSLPTLLHMCEGLNTNLKDFFNDSIFLDVEDDEDEDEDDDTKNTISNNNYKL